MDGSLYQLALQSKSHSPALAISPSALKSLVNALIDVLIEQHSLTTLIVKLPTGESWQAEVKRYQQQVGIPRRIYLCNLSSPEIERWNRDAFSQIVPINLPTTSLLKREYFVLALSDNFCTAILAHRNSPFKSVVSEELSKKPRLETLIACDRETVQQVLEGIKQATQHADVCLSNRELLENWDTVFSLPQTFDPSILNHLLIKQVQRQEEMWQLLSKQKSLSEDKPIPEAEVIPPIPAPKLEATEAKDDFFSHVVQELRMPLTNMKTALTLLDSPHIKGGQRQRYLQLLNTECDRQNSLISSLLELLQLERTPEQTNVQPVHPIDIIPSVVSTYQPLAQEKGIQLGYTVPNNMPPVVCSETWLKQITVNLLHNSIKYTPKGGQVSVRVKLQDQWVQIEFRDTGVGIAPGEIDKIFDRFYRGRTNNANFSPGAGLGLTIVHELVTRCGGSISVTSKVGEGSHFRLLLPALASTSV